MASLPENVPDLSTLSVDCGVWVTAQMAPPMEPARVASPPLGGITKPTPSWLTSPAPMPTWPLPRSWHIAFVYVTVFVPTVTVTVPAPDREPTDGTGPVDSLAAGASLWAAASDATALLGAALAPGVGVADDPQPATMTSATTNTPIRNARIESSSCTEPFNRTAGRDGIGTIVVPVAGPRKAIDTARKAPLRKRALRLRTGRSALLGGWDAHREPGGHSPRWENLPAAEGLDARPTNWPPGPRRATGGPHPRACVQRALLPMEPGLTPAAVPTRGASTRTVLVALGAGLALIVGVGILGKGAAPPCNPPLPAAIIAATPHATPTPTLRATPEPLATTEPSVTEPPTAPPLVPRSGTAKVTTGSVAVLSEPRALVPTGIEILLTPRPYSWGVVDGKGVVWAYASGVLTRYDPAARTGRTWTATDDARFVASEIAPARSGGVWLVTSSTVRRFDGSGFRTAFDIGGDVWALADGPDGSLWAATQDGAIVHVAGTTQTRIDPPRPSADAFITALAVDGSGGIWCGWIAVDAGVASWVARYDGSTWRVFDATDAAPLGSGTRTITPFPDGSVWVATDSGLARFDGTGWIDLTSVTPTPTSVTSVARGSGGATWIVTADPANGAVGVARLDGASGTNVGSWTRWGPADGLPDATQAGMFGAWVVPAKGGILVVAGDGVYRLSTGTGQSGGRWSRVWPAAAPSGPGRVDRLLAVSHDEAWASEAGAVWHFVNGAWSGPFIGTTSSGFFRDLLRTPDGSVWAAADVNGLYRWNGSTWSQVSKATIVSLAIGRDGVVRAAWDSGIGVVVRSLYLDGRTWREGASTARVNFEIAGPIRLAVGRDGTIWVGTTGFFGTQPGLFRYVDGAWAMVYPTGGTAPVAVSDLSVAPNGDVWVVGRSVDTVSGQTSVGPSWIARFDGTHWTLPGEATWLTRANRAAGITAAADGTIWVWSLDGLARFDGTRWTRLYETLSFSAISVAPDGTVWANGPFGVTRLPAP